MSRRSLAQQGSFAEQALQAKNAGIAEVVRLLQQPEDLARLPQLLADYDQRAKSNRAALSASVQSQVEAARFGLELLDKSHHHIARLRASLEKIDRLCSECTSLIDHHERIRVLSMAYKNVSKVLEELEDIIDLPARAAMVADMLDDDTLLLKAYEGLTVLEGTSNNAKQAWHRSVKKQEEISDLTQYLGKVTETMERFEIRLWDLVANYDVLAQDNPRLLVDCLKIVDIQESLDAHCRSAKLAYLKPKEYRSKALLVIEQAIDEKFNAVIEASSKFGVPNVKLSYDQHGLMVLHEQRDYLGSLVAVVRVDKQGKQVPTTAEELAALEIRSEDVFQEDPWMDTLLADVGCLEAELATVYDYVAPCFPPSYCIFDIIFQHYHVRFAMVVDGVGLDSAKLSTKSLLKIMGWVSGYQDTLRNLGVEEEMVRLPVAPQSDPEDKPGFMRLIEVYTNSMEESMTVWFNNILDADMKTDPRDLEKTQEGALRTKGSVDFFRILNEQVSIVQDISRGQVLFEAAQRALKIMRGFTEAQVSYIRRDLSLELFCALLNNNVECYNQSLEFTEHVQALLEDTFKERLEVEEVCRSFLDVAKAAMRRIVDIVFSDPGTIATFKALYVTKDWLSGVVTGTILATVNDYYADISTFVEQSFVKRVAEATLEEMVRRFVSALMVQTPSITPALVARMEADEQEIDAYFTSHIKQDRVSKYVQQLTDLRELTSSDCTESFVLAYTSLLESSPAITPAMLEKLCAARSDLTKADIADIVAQCKDVHKQRMKVLGPGAPQEGKGWKFWK